MKKNKLVFGTMFLACALFLLLVFGSGDAAVASEGEEYLVFLPIVCNDCVPQIPPPPPVPGECPVGFAPTRSEVDNLNWEGYCAREGGQWNASAANHPVGVLGTDTPFTDTVYLDPDRLPYGSTGWPNLTGYNPVVLLAGYNTVEVDPQGVAGATWGFAPNPAAVPLAYADLDMPLVAVTGQEVGVQVWVAPVNATLPVTFTVEADDLESVTQVVYGTVAEFLLEWSEPGWKLVTVTAQNVAGPAVEAIRWIEIGAPPSGIGLELSDHCLVWHTCFITATVGSGSWPLTYTLTLPGAEPVVRASTSSMEFFEINPAVSGPYTATLMVENTYGSAVASETFTVYACPEWLGVTQTMAGTTPWQGFCGDEAFNAAAQATGVMGGLELAESAVLTFWANPFTYPTGGTFWPETPGNWHSVSVSPGLNTAFFDTLGINPSRWGFAAGAASSEKSPLADPW